MARADVRWKQRFSNYLRALERLVAAVELAATRPLSDLEQQGLIQSFKFTHELAWNVMKDFFVDLDHAIDDLLLPWGVDLAVWHLIDNPDLKAHVERIGIQLTPWLSQHVPDRPASR